MDRRERRAKGSGSCLAAPPAGQLPSTAGQTRRLQITLMPNRRPETHSIRQIRSTSVDGTSSTWILSVGYAHGPDDLSVLAVWSEIAPLSAEGMDEEKPAAALSGWPSFDRGIVGTDRHSAVLNGTDRIALPAIIPELGYRIRNRNERYFCFGSRRPRVRISPSRPPTPRSEAMACHLLMLAQQSE